MADEDFAYNIYSKNMLKFIENACTKNFLIEKTNKDGNYDIKRNNCANLGVILKNKFLIIYFSYAGRGNQIFDSSVCELRKLALEFKVN